MYIFRFENNIVKCVFIIPFNVLQQPQTPLFSWYLFVCRVYMYVDWEHTPTGRHKYFKCELCWTYVIFEYISQTHSSKFQRYTFLKAFKLCEHCVSTTYEIRDLQPITPSKNLRLASICFRYTMLVNILYLRSIIPVGRNRWLVVIHGQKHKNVFYIFRQLTET